MNLLEFVAATLGPEDASNEVYLRSAFEILDRNDNDGITSGDLKGTPLHALAYRSVTSHISNGLMVSELLGSHFDEAACHEMIKRFDVDKDGKVGFEDFTKMMRVRMLGVSWSQAEEMLAFDSHSRMKCRSALPIPTDRRRTDWLLAPALRVARHRLHCPHRRHLAVARWLSVESRQAQLTWASPSSSTATAQGQQSRQTLP